MLEFKVNKFVTLKLENEKTDIYVNGELFNQCKYVLIRKKIDELEDLLEIGSVDELAEASIDYTAKNLDHSPKNLFEKEKLEGFEIPPHVRFWVHCSNLQAWHENNYDTCLLHSNLAFPLLKKLSDVGDPIAKIVFKEEIIKRLRKGYDPITQYLLDNKYLAYLTREELINNVLVPQEAEILKEIENVTNTEYGLVDSGFSRAMGDEDQYEAHFAVREGYITRLEFISNDECKFPESMQELHDLKVLEIIIEYEMTRFPEPLPKLESLEELSINTWGAVKNTITSFDQSPNLKRLYISCGYEYLLSAVFNSKSLEFVSINDKRIEKMPDSIESLRKIIETPNLKGI